MDAIIGDIDERYSRGFSRAWYWRQSLVAILASFLKEILDHKLRALFAIVTGQLIVRSAIYVLNYYVFAPVVVSPGFVFPQVWRSPDAVAPALIGGLFA